MKRIIPILLVLLYTSTNLLAYNDEFSWFKKGVAFSVFNNDKIINCTYFAGGNTSVRALDFTLEFVNPRNHETIKKVKVNFFKKLESLNVPSQNFHVTKNELTNILPKGKFVGNDLIFSIKNKIFKLSLKEDNASTIELIYESTNTIYDVHVYNNNIYSIDAKGVQQVLNNKSLIKWAKQNWKPDEFKVDINNKNQLGLLTLGGLDKGNDVHKSIVFDLNENRVLKTYENQNIISVLNNELVLSYLNETTTSDIKIENFKTSKIVSQNTSGFINYNTITKTVVCDNRFVAIEVAKKIFVIDILSGDLKQTIPFENTNQLTDFNNKKLYFVSKNVSIDALFKVEIDKKAPAFFINSLSKTTVNTTTDSFTNIQGSFVDNSGLKSITINNENVKFNTSNGSFNFTSNLKIGTNKFVISGTDTFNNTHTETIILKREEAQIVASTRGAQAKSTSIEKQISDFSYKALLISNENYNDDVGKLNFPVSDAEKISDALLKHYTFEKEDIVHLKNATRFDIINTLDSLSTVITSKDNLLIFYAGHGVFDENLNKGYWLPVDANASKKNNWVSNSDIRDYITAFKSQHTLLISDACFSGSIFEYKQRSLNSREKNITEKLLSKKSRKAMTSGLNKTVPDKSTFIKYLITNLKENKKPYLRAGELYNDIREAVMANTDNNPQFEVIKNSNHEGGEFIFMKKN